MVGVLVFTVFTVVYTCPFCCLVVGSVDTGSLDTDNGMGFLPRNFRLRGCMGMFRLGNLKATTVMSLKEAIVNAVYAMLTSICLKFVFARRQV